MEDINHEFKSNFSFLEPQFPLLSNLGTASEYHLYTDPVVALIKLRQFGESVTEIVFNEHGLQFPYDNTFHNRLKVLDDENLLPYRVKDLLFTIKNKGNTAVHDNKGSVDEAKTALFSAFKVAKWIAETYGTVEYLDQLKYTLPPNLDARFALSILEHDFKELEQKFKKAVLDRDIKEVTPEWTEQIKAKAERAASKIDMSEAVTRELIDEQLRLSGWEADTNNLNYKLKGTTPDRKRKIAIAEWKVGNKWADYALFIGQDLYGIIEAKKYDQDISTNLRQSKVYAELAGEQNNARLMGHWGNYKVPFLFSTNGRPYLEQIKTKSGIWFIDVRKNRNSSRVLHGFYSPDGLIKLYEQNVEETESRLKNESLDFLSSNIGLGLRYYQIEAIKKVEEKILSNFDERKALLAMATGTGKTRTVVGLCYRLISTNKFNRILYLVDRTILGTQAQDAFKDNKVKDLNTFSEIYGVEELKKVIPDIDTRLHFATVQGMMKRLLYNESKDSIPSVDAYDCIIVDEAHRGYLLDREMDDDDIDFKDQKDYVSKYRMVLEYFDAYAIGLTATPALHTTQIFGLPVYNYSYREAVIDGFLVDHDPPYVINTKLNEEGIKWVKGEKPKVYDKETNTIKELSELEDELSFDIEGFNKTVITENFNRTVLSELIKYLDPESEEKTLIFAATDDHADMVVQILKEEFKKIGVDLNDNTIEKITGKAYKPQELVRQFKNEVSPNIAVTVDLLSTGVDVPKICNIVFLRRVKSRILFEQMLGRATRKCDEIGKEAFQIFDAVNIYSTLEKVTNMKLVVQNPSFSFKELAGEMEAIDYNERAQKQVEQIVAKLQRKKKLIKEDTEKAFSILVGGGNVDAFIENLLTGNIGDAKQRVINLPKLWHFLDELKSEKRFVFYSEHEDSITSTERGYGYGNKPEDYLDQFKQFIEENKTKITALNVICTKPQELDRKSLKELKLELDFAGFNSRTLNTAWKASKNEDIAADIISYIRTLALGDSLLSHEERIVKAVDKVRQLKSWNKIQTKWIDRIEKQLLNETILQVEDFDQSPFMMDGGFTRLNKIFDSKLTDIIQLINDNLYSETA